MPNTVYGPYIKTVWNQGSTPTNQTNMRNLETQASVALNGFNGDLLTPFVLSGIVASKDGSIANQLDVTSGRAYLAMSDSTIGLIATVASTPGQFTTSTPSTTYHLYLQPDGTWYWSTSNTPATNSLAIADVATDVSGNISTVTDKRSLNTTLLSGVGGLLGLGGSGMAYADAAGNLTGLALIASRALGGATRILQKWVATDGHTWTLSQDVSGNLLLADTNTSKQWTFGNGGAFVIPGNLFSVGGQSTVGSFGVALIIAQAIDVAVTTTSVTTLLTYTPAADGVFRFSGSIRCNGSALTQNLKLFANYQHPLAAGTAQAYVTSAGNPVDGSVAYSATANTYPVDAMTIRSKASVAITVQYQAPSATPNDHITIIMEQLA